MHLIKLHKVLVVGGAALVASCGDSSGSQQQTVINLSDAAVTNDATPPSADAAPQDDGQGVDAWLSWVTADAAPFTDAETPTEDAADAAPSDSGNAAEAAPADAQGVDAWLSWA